jgi:CPA1 family monovalent cation:H+ antiporter
VETLVLVVGLMLAAVLLVGVGDRLRLPWPALMLLLGVGVAFAPGLPDRFDLDPELILPLFLPPLLFAAAQRTSWALFRARWRSIAFLAVALVVATVAAVAGTAAVLVPGIGISAAIALGAMVAPPDPVAVEAVAGPVRMPRRLLSVLQSEGLFNDATALVVFQSAVLATVSGGTVSAPTLVLRFVLGVVGAVVIGVLVALVARWITARVTDTTGRSALTLVLPFAVYLAADEVGASGVVAVVVLALQLRSASGEDEAAERLVQRSFWDVVELLVTGVAFGLMGLDLRQVAEAAADDLPRMLRDAAVILAVVIAVRVLWMLVAWWMADAGGLVDGLPQRRPRAVAAHRAGDRRSVLVRHARAGDPRTGAVPADGDRLGATLPAARRDRADRGGGAGVHARDPRVHAALPRPAARGRHGRRRGARRRAGDRAARPIGRDRRARRRRAGRPAARGGRHEPAAADGPPRRPAARRPDVDGGPRTRRNRAPLP